MAIGDIIVSLDIGASKTAAVVGQVNKFGEIEVVGYGLSKSSGIKKGRIVNSTAVAESLVKAITEAEDTAGLYINSAYVNIKGLMLTILINSLLFNPLLVKKSIFSLTLSKDTKYIFSFSSSNLFKLSLLKP